jgi:hypothetical protein
LAALRMGSAFGILVSIEHQELRFDMLPNSCNRYGLVLSDRLGRTVGSH